MKGLAGMGQLPSARSFNSGVTVDGKFIIFGGKNQQLLDDLHAFNLSSKS